MAGSGFTAKQKRFIDEYLVDGNATQAAERAGYSARSAHQLGHELLNTPSVRAEIDRRELNRSAATKERSERAALTKEWVVDVLMENIERSMQAIAVTDRDGKETGEYRYDGHAVNGAARLLGMELGMFKQRVAVELPPDERRRRVMSILSDAAKRRKAAKGEKPKR